MPYQYRRVKQALEAYVRARTYHLYFPTKTIGHYVNNMYHRVLLFGKGNLKIILVGILSTIPYIKPEKEGIQ